MSPTVINFIKSSLVYLLIGVILGVILAMRILPDATVPQYINTAHAHINLLGWVSMLMFGVGIHILPRFSGQPLYSESMSTAQLWLNNIGLVGMVVALFVDAYSQNDLMRYAVAPFGALYAIGAFLFVYNLGKTIARALPAPTPPRAAGPAAKK